MTNLRDYDRDATLIEKVRDLERQLADAQAAIETALTELRRSPYHPWKEKVFAVLESTDERVMDDLRDYDRDVLLIERVRDLEQQLADARESLDIAYAKGREDGRAEIERLLNELQDRNGIISRLKHELYTYRDRPGDE